MAVFSKLSISAATTSAISPLIDTNTSVYLSVTGVTTGSIAGSIQVQVSNEFDIAGELANFTPLNWVNLPSAVVTLSGTAGAFVIPKFDSCYRWIRLVFTATGGTGTCSAWVKGVNV